MDDDKKNKSNIIIEKAKSKVSPSLEDYLETILFIQQKKSEVRVTDIAEAMTISKPSVNKAISILKNQGFVNHEHYGSLSLTNKGLEIATNVATRHFALSRFLHDFLDVAEDIAEEEACLLEHAISFETMTRLINFMDKLSENNSGVQSHNQ